jgi:hypothetical protein
LALLLNSIPALLGVPATAVAHPQKCIHSFISSKSSNRAFLL